MNELLIRVSSVLYERSEVLVNGQKAEFANNGRGSYEANIQTSGSDEIQIVRNHELATPLWLLWGLFFFIISCFGIFDVGYSKAAPLRCVINVTTTGSGKVQLTPNVSYDGTGVVIANSDCEVSVVENMSDNALIKKRLKTLRIIKLLLWAALIATIIAIVIL